ncbi:hypothetical protein HanIR_Chr13g0632091 [Helianthus annuus]|nr:hypothetical protein HanIR_Chr13g0632091 [Helianthus annuus]
MIQNFLLVGMSFLSLKASTPSSKVESDGWTVAEEAIVIFRQLDGLAEEIQRSQPPIELWRKFIYCTSLTGSVIGSVDHMQSQDFDQIASRVSVAHFSQYKLNALLIKQLEPLDSQFVTRD